jgi:predicted HicB family RNase H-like nuclease
MYSQILADRIRLIKYGLSREIQQGGKSMTEYGQYAYNKILAESNGNEGVAYFASLIFEGFVKETEARVAKETEARVAKETEARLEKEFKARVEKEVAARVARETEARVTKEVKARLEKEFEARVEKEFQARMAKNQDKK